MSEKPHNNVIGTHITQVLGVTCQKPTYFNVLIFLMYAFRRLLPDFSDLTLNGLSECTLR